MANGTDSRTSLDARAQRSSSKRAKHSLEHAVREGLSKTQKTLPPWLLYDAAGVELYERITELPEYYLTRAEADLFTQHSDALLALASGDARVSVAELGAGTATKTELLLRAAVRRQGECVFLACDIAPSGLQEGAARIRSRLPSVEVQTVVGTHETALPRIAALPERQLLLFIGSSIGNLNDREAVALLTSLRGALRPDGMFLLGADAKKDLAKLIAAYDDAQGVTAKFNKNLLVRINRELDADFALDAFVHRAAWNEAACCIEMHLVSTRAQTVHIRALEMTIDFTEGEHIHTESSAKYDLKRVDALLTAAGFSRLRTFQHPEHGYSLHLARVQAGMRPGVTASASQ